MNQLIECYIKTKGVLNMVFYHVPKISHVPKNNNMVFNKYNKIFNFKNKKIQLYICNI